MRQAGRLEELHATYGDRAQFLVVYIREAHAADGDFPIRRGPRIFEPRTLQERKRVARRCAQAVRFTMPMVIDTLDDGAARMYGGHPDRLYVVGKDGRVAYRSGPGPRGFRPDEMEQALKRLIANDGVRRAWRF